MDYRYRMPALFRPCCIRCVSIVSHSCYSVILTAYTAGSWEGDIRIWKVDLKLKSLVLVGTIPAPGYVNSLQLLSPPDKALDGVSWAEGNIVAEADLINGHPGAKGNPTVLMVAGISQEPRLGRWRRVKGEGVVNGALVIALHTRTSSN